MNGIIHDVLFCVQLFKFKVMSRSIVSYIIFYCSNTGTVYTQMSNIGRYSLFKNLSYYKYSYQEYFCIQSFFLFFFLLLYTFNNFSQYIPRLLTLGLLGSLLFNVRNYCQRFPKVTQQRTLPSSVYESFGLLDIFNNILLNLASIVITYYITQQF